MNCNHPVVEKLIIKCLVFWVQEMHVDGFRFDEGSILTRGIDGRPMEYPPVLWNIELNDVLASTKIIAEPWDASGLYQVGNFPGYRWAVWNGQYRDVIRRFVKGDSGLIGVVASRLGGSQDIFREPGQRPTNGINFITCHDGFTLYDLVSYNEKHNLENGEDNRDGWNSHASWNCGVEGETANPDVLALRARQMRNFLTILFLSQGVPMLLAGDEVGRTQRGNNNAYCQDNELSWFDWRLPMQQSDLLRFVRMLIALRKQHANLHRIAFFSGTRDKTGRKDIEWHGCRLLTPEWDNPAARTLAFTIRGDGKCTDIHVMMNMDKYSHHFELPFAQKQAWRMLINTAFSAPWDICEEERAQSVYERSCCVEGRSIIVLIAE